MSRNIKEHLDYLYYDVGKQRYDFFVSGLWRTEEEGDKSTKWHKYSDKVMVVDAEEWWRIRWINQRQILPNEVIIDLEERETIQDVVKSILDKGMKFKVFDTGSRGFHIHIFFDKDLTEKQKLRLIKMFNGDEQMAKERHLINLEWAPHWKSKKIKKEISIKEILTEGFK